MAAPINSVKHYVQFTNATIASGAASGRQIANAVVAPATGTTAEVAEGSVIKAVWLEFWIVSDEASGTESQFTFAFEKRPSNAPAMTFTNTQNLGAYPNKKNILYVTQGILGASVDGQSSIPVIRQFMLIPKGKQRMGLGDDLVVTIGAVGGISVCGFSTYKEYK